VVCLILYQTSENDLNDFDFVPEFFFVLIILYIILRGGKRTRSNTRPLRVILIQKHKKNNFFL